MSLLKFIPPVIAHRGASALAPENTLAAFLKAQQMGIKWVEFDVMLTACGEAVVIHDETLNRTTNGTGNVADVSAAYLKTLDAGSWFSPLFKDEKISTFVEVIKFLNQHGLHANVEIKAVPGQEEIIVEKVLADIHHHWNISLMPPLISSFSLPVLQAARKLSPHAMLGLLVDQWFPDWEEISNQLNCISVNANFHILDAEKVKRIKLNNKLVLSYTVNTFIQARELFSWGVDAVFSDDPSKILK